MAASVSRWRRYGRDRLYVAGEDGAGLGYRDLQTGRDHLERPDRQAEFHAAVTYWLMASRSRVPGQSSATAAAVDLPEPAPQPPAAAPGPTTQPLPPGVEPRMLDELDHGERWEDLATREAGAMAGQQALLLKRAAPVRTVLARILGIHTDERAWRIGAQGERKVAKALTKLASKDLQWRFLHAIPVGERGSDIDHLVIGPGGVLTLNAKHHPGAQIWIAGDTFMVNGRRQPYVRNCLHEAARASRLLAAACGFRVQVHGVVVLVGIANLTIKTPPADISVVTLTKLAPLLRSLPQGLTQQHIDGVFDAARRSTTWQPHR